MRTAACLSLVALALLAPAVSTEPATAAERSSEPATAAERSSARREASLRIVEDHYVGGQAVTFVGNVGEPGRRRVHLQMNMGGPEWNNLEGNPSWWTTRDGSFRFRYKALSMFNIRARVAGRGVATPPITMFARSQDLVAAAPARVAVGQTFRIGVDTTPVLKFHPDLIGLPTFPGRVLTLQRRNADGRWTTLKQPGPTRVDSRGLGSFTLASDQPGLRVYRVRQEAVTTGLNEIGWFPSFPVFVQVGGGALRLSPPAITHDADLGTAAEPAATDAAEGATASQRYGWSPARWDFAWEFGESLTSRPYRGTDRPLRGRWVETSTGNGRAAKYIGGLLLDSQRHHGGSDDHGFGTTKATLQGNPMTYGRWEVRMRVKPLEFNRGNYHARIALVPARGRDRCVGQVTVADVLGSRPSIQIGVRSDRQDRQWRATRQYGSPESQHAIAVEVGRRHISWFVDGKVIGTVKNRAAVPKVPLTLQLSLVGDGNRRMNKTQFQSDWQRGFSLDRGRMVKSGPGLSAASWTGGC